MLLIHLGGFRRRIDFTPHGDFPNINCKPQNHSGWRLVNVRSVSQLLPCWGLIVQLTIKNMSTFDVERKFEEICWIDEIFDSLQNGFIECEKDSCPAVDDCYALVKKSSESCCDKCKGELCK